MSDEKKFEDKENKQDDLENTQEQEENQDAEDKQEIEEEAYQEIKEVQPSRRRFRFSFFWSAIIILVIIIIILGLAWHTGRNNNNAQFNKHIGTLQQASSQSQMQIASVKQQLSNLQQKITTLETKSGEQDNNIKLAESTSARLQNELLGKQSGWLIDEALYLTHLAKYNLEFQHNIPSSILLLKNADNALFRTGNPNVTNSRRMIANDIATLEALPKVDTSGLYLRLDALNRQIDKLPILAQNPAANKVKTKGTKHDSWKDAVKENMHSIGKLIVIQRRDKPIVPLLSPEEYGMLNQYIALLFGHAEWALLHRSPAIYQTALSQIATTVETYYATSSVATKAMLKSISDLKKVDIAPKTPDLTNTVNTLTELSTQDNKLKPKIVIQTQEKGTAE